MPYENENERVADVDGESLLCWESEGFLRPETTIDLHAGSFETLPWSQRGISKVDEGWMDLLHVIRRTMRSNMHTHK
jgi:hypothetical protein